MPMQPEVINQSSCPVIPPCIPGCANQVIVNDEVVIPPQKPPQEQIIDFRVSCSVTGWEVIGTALGQKVIVDGNVHVAMQYIANVPEQSVHFAEWDIPWHTFFLCSAITVCDVACCIEFAEFEPIDERRISKTMVLMVCARDCTAPPCQPCQP